MAQSMNLKVLGVKLADYLFYILIVIKIKKFQEEEEKEVIYS